MNASGEVHDATCDSTSRRLALRLLLLAAVAATAWVWATLLSGWLKGGKATHGGGPRLVIRASELNLGSVHETNSLEHSFHVTNQGEQPVTIERISKDCECLQITPGPGTELAAGETKQFNVMFSLAGRQLVTGGAGAYPLRISFDMTYDVGGQTERTEWQFVCTVIPTIQPKLTVLELGLVSDREAAWARTVEVAATPEVASLTCSAPEHWAVSAIHEPGAAPTAKFRVTVRPSGKLVPRLVDDLILLTPETSTGRTLPAKKIRIAGEVVSDVISTPREIHLGRQPRGGAVEESILLRSLTGRNFGVKVSRARSGELEVAKAEGQGACVYSLRLHVRQFGDQELVAEFVIEHEDKTESILKVPVRYQGASKNSAEGLP